VKKCEKQPTKLKTKDVKSTDEVFARIFYVLKWNRDEGTALYLNISLGKVFFLLFLSFSRIRLFLSPRKIEIIY
jgi:hypothetical protein